MARILRISVLVSAVLAGCLIVACGSGGSESPSDANSANTTEPTNTAEPAAESHETADFFLPSPLQIAAIFNKSGLEYVEGVANPPENISKYTSSMSKALNFGVYSADLSYCVLNNQTQEARKYLKNVKDLSDQLGMAAIFTTEQLFESFERNLGNRDSTLYTLATIQEQLDDYLEENQQEYMTSVFFAGAFLEGMYVGSQVSSANRENTQLAKKLVEQLTILENLTKALHHYPNPNQELLYVMEQLDNLKNQFNNIAAIKSMRDKGDEFSFEDATFSREELDGLTSSIQTIRNKIVNG